MSVLWREEMKSAYFVARLFIIVIFSSSLFAFSQVEVVHLPLDGFFALDGVHLWAALHNARGKHFVLRSTDGGVNWKSTEVPFRIWGMFFLSPAEGWALSAEGTGKSVGLWCVHTSDSGQTWQYLARLQEGDNFNGPVFDTVTHGWIVGREPIAKEPSDPVPFLLETSDGGEHWNKLNWSEGPHSGANGISTHNGVVYAWSGSSDEPGLFELQPGLVPRRIFGRESMGIAFGAENSIISVGTTAVYIGPDWETVLSNSTVFRDVSFADSAHGCVVGNTIFCTEDGGISWTSRPLPKSRNAEEVLYRLYLFEPSHGWAEAEDKLFETNDGAYTWHQVRLLDSKGQPLAQLFRNRD